MRTHTTYTDLRRIMKLHTEGQDVAHISEAVFIDPKEVQFVIDARTKSTKRSKKMSNEVTRD